jgi:hypothetical protein
MQELITRLTEKAGINADQASKALETIKDFVKEKFPMMAGAVDNLFSAPAETTTTAAASAIIDPAAPKTTEPTILDKISEVIPGETGQKVENFVKGAAVKAEDVLEDVKEKLSDARQSETGQKVEGFVKGAAEKAEDVFDEVKEKLSDARQSETGQKVEGFVKGAAEKAEEVFSDVKEKLGGLFGGEKKV